MAEKVTKQKEKAEERRGNKIKNIDEWVLLTEKTFNFAFNAKIWFENGTDDDRKAILACLGSNLTIKDKKLNVSLHPYFQSLIKAKVGVPGSINPVRTPVCGEDKRKNRDIDPVLSSKHGW